MEKTVIQKAIEKIDEQIEIAQACRIEASKIKDETSTSRHHGMKIGLVSFKQALINLLELEKLQNHSEYMRGWYGGFNGKEIETKRLEQTAVEWLTEKLRTEFGFAFSNNILNQAKEMEKQQIIDAFNKGFVTDQWDKSKENKSEQYYNKTFKSE